MKCATDSYTVDRKFLEELLAHVEDGHVFGSERALMAGRIQAILNQPCGPITANELADEIGAFLGNQPPATGERNGT